jgi:hypothetical protein
MPRAFVRGVAPQAAESLGEATRKQFG